MSVSYPLTSQLTSSPSITRTKCVLKRRCTTSMLIRLALRSLRRSSESWTGLRHRRRFSGSALVAEWIRFSVSMAPGMRRMTPIHPCQSSLNHGADHESKEGGQTVAAAGQEMSPPWLRPRLISVGVSRGFVKICWVLAYCQRSRGEAE